MSRSLKINLGLRFYERFLPPFHLEGVQFKRKTLNSNPEVNQRIPAKLAIADDPERKPNLDLRFFEPFPLEVLICDASTPDQRRNRWARKSEIAE